MGMQESAWIEKKVGAGVRVRKFRGRMNDPATAVVVRKMRLVVMVAPGYPNSNGCTRELKEEAAGGSSCSYSPLGDESRTTSPGGNHGRISKGDPDVQPKSGLSPIPF